MPVTLAVLAVALVAASVVWLLARRPFGLDPIDPEAEERRLVRWLIRHRRWGQAAGTIHRRTIGGLVLVLALVVVLATALVVGLVFDMVDQHSGLARWDRAVANWGSQHATSTSTAALDLFTQLGSTTVLIVISSGIAMWDYVRRRNAEVAAFLFTVLVGVILINNELKSLVDRERPDVTHLVGTSGSSFPSGHSAAAAAVWCAIALVVSRRWSRRRRAVASAVAAMVALAVAASRALLGVHWLTDVVAGLAVGWGWFFLSALVFGGRLQRLGEPAASAAVAASASGRARQSSSTLGGPSK
jgi:undecaprenyl-diphosphatase